MALRSLLALLLCVPACECLVVGGAAGVARPVQLRVNGRAFTMKSQEDKEFEEWVRQKKIASGIDPDEDFGAGRRAEGSIYLVGGLITVLVPVIAGLWAYNEGYL